MDFAPSAYTPEQEHFRQEVRIWLEQNVPRITGHPDTMSFATASGDGCSV